MIRHKFAGEISHYWALPLIIGLICLGLGIWAICAPTSALPVIATVFAIGLLAVGCFDAIWSLATTRINPGWGWDLCVAAIDIICGIWMLGMSPSNMTLTFLYIVGFWMIFAAFNGIGQIFAVSIYNPAAMVLAVLLLIVTLFFSFWLIFNPVGLGVTAWIWVGIALCCFGIFKMSLAFKIRNYRAHLQ